MTPAFLPVWAEAIPAELRDRAQWVCWRYVQKQPDKKPTKIPFSVTGDPASSIDPATWSTFDEALHAYEVEHRFDGIGYVFSPDDPYVGIDLDNCIDLEEEGDERNPDPPLADWALDIVHSLDSYTEVSPSGTGVKIWVRGAIPTALKTRTAPIIEIYSEGRYFCVTGQPLNCAHPRIREVNGQLDELYEDTKARRENERRAAPRASAPASGGFLATSTALRGWAQDKLSEAIRMVVGAADGSKHHTLYDAARLAGGAVPHISESEIESALYAAIASRADDQRGAMKTIQDGIEKGKEKPLSPPEQPCFTPDGWACCPRHNDTPLVRTRDESAWRCGAKLKCFWWQGDGYTEPAAPRPQPAPLARVEPELDTTPAPTPESGAQVQTLAQLLNEELPPVRWVIPGLLSEGAALLLGKPKMGKSWLSLSSAIAVASGGMVLGRMPVEVGAVLYLALEDGRRRLQARCKKLLGTSKPPRRMHVATSWKRLDGGGVEDLEHWLQTTPEARLVVIDTLAKVRPQRQRGGNVYEEDYQPLQALSELANHYHVAILIVHHMRKAGAEDFLDSASGTTGLTGAVDTVMALQRERGQADAVLAVTGRDLESDPELAVAFDHATAQWVVLGEAAEHRMSQESREILEFIRDNGGNAMSPKEISELSDRPYVNIKSLMYKMSKRGELRMAGRGKYEIGSVEPAPVAKTTIHAQKSDAGYLGHPDNLGYPGDLGYFHAPGAGFVPVPGFGAYENPPPESNQSNHGAQSNQSNQGNQTMPFSAPIPPLNHDDSSSEGEGGDSGDNVMTSQPDKAPRSSFDADKARALKAVGLARRTKFREAYAAAHAIEGRRKRDEVLEVIARIEQGEVEETG